jgi:hypothetical protein
MASALVSACGLAMGASTMAGPPQTAAMATDSCLLAGWSGCSHSTSASSTSVAIAPPASASADAPASSTANAAAAAVSEKSAGAAPGSTAPATARSARRRGREPSGGVVTRRFVFVSSERTTSSSR